MTTAEQLTFALAAERQDSQLPLHEPDDAREHWAAALFDRHGRWTRVATQPYGAARGDRVDAVSPLPVPATNQPPR